MKEDKREGKIGQKDEREVFPLLRAFQNIFTVTDMASYPWEG